MMIEQQYQEYLDNKRIKVMPSGFSVPEDHLHPEMFPHQKAITSWGLQRGKAAIFADCGLMKTLMQLEWAEHVAMWTDKPVIIFAPLAVSLQTQREGEHFGIEVTVCESQADVREGTNITNYEKMHHFDADAFGGIVLDESSMLKAFVGTMKTQVIRFGSSIPYRLCCTATPAPNDLTELCNHAEFLGIMKQKEVEALFFTQDGNSSNHYRLKGHAQKAFWEWVASWAVALRKPSDLGPGFSDEGFELPPLHITEITVDTEWKPEGFLIPTMAVGLSEQRQARRDSLEERVKICADMVNPSKEPWMVWCDLNAESEALKKAIPGAVEVKGSDSAKHKEWAMLAFATGEIRVLISKPSICGFGMNWQHCGNVVYVGISNSYEAFYQSIRRFHRFGRKGPVTAYIITSEAEGNIVENIKRKEEQASKMMDSIVQRMSGLSLGMASRQNMAYREDVAKGQDWTFYLGDSVKQIDNIPSNSVGLSVFSPPFPGMYVYTNSEHDIGNVSSINDMIEHFRYLMSKDKLYRVMMPGRHAMIHLTQAVAQKGRDGYIGLKDFRGAVIRMMEEEGWIYYGEITIQKNPQVKAIRTKDRGLMFKTLANDSSHMHVALADYVLQFRKPGENPEPIRAGISTRYNNPDGWVSNEEWIKWAHPIWTDINETNVLNVVQARETDDERHLCPLQIDVIERCVRLWSNPGETVFSPFGGIGSEGYVALKAGRKAILCELKESYWRSGIDNLKRAIQESKQTTLFDLLEMEQEAEVEELSFE